MRQSWRFVRSQISTPSFGSKPDVSSVSGAKRNSQTTEVRSDVERDDPRRHDEVRLDGQEHRRENRVVVDALPLLFREVPERRPAHPAARRHAAALVVDDHVPAEDAAVPEIVGPAPVVREPGQGRMDGGAVVALLEILEEKFPVGGDVVLDAPRLSSRARRQGANRPSSGSSAWSSGGSGAGARLRKRNPSHSARAAARAAGTPPCRTTARPPCAARRAAFRRARRSRRGTGTGSRPPGGPRVPSQRRVPRWRHTLKNARARPSRPRTAIRLSDPAAART